MSAFQFEKLLRDNIRNLKPYTSARSEYNGEATVFLDANENAVGGAAGPLYQRYPDPLQKTLKQAISRIKDISPDRIFLGNGSDEPIDLLIRAVCEPSRDNILIFPPTYGMYEVSAQINDIEVKKVTLTEDFQVDIEQALQAIDVHTRVIFFCSPNNPTGNLLNPGAIEQVLAAFNGLVIVDEAYIDFAASASWIEVLDKYPNLVVLQTYSKAWGMAGLRLGMAFASAEIILTLNNIKAPYNINLATQQLALSALEQAASVRQWTETLCNERARVAVLLGTFPFILKVYPSDANFILLQVTDANGLYRFLLDHQVVVRNRSNQPGCEECLRITIGTVEENDLLLKTFNSYSAMRSEPA